MKNEVKSSFPGRKAIPAKYKKFIYAFAGALAIIIVGINTCSKDESVKDQAAQATTEIKGNASAVTYDVNGNPVKDSNPTLVFRQLGRYDIGQIRYYYYVKGFDKNNPACWNELDKVSSSIVDKEPDGVCVFIEYQDNEKLYIDRHDPGLLVEEKIPHVILQYVKYTNGKINSQDDPYGQGKYIRVKK